MDKNLVNKKEDSLTELANLATIKMSHAYQHYDESRGLTQYTSIILYELLTHEQMAQKELVYRSGIPKQSINKGMHQLEDAGYLTLTPSPDDKRVKFCALTDKGQTYAKEKIAPLVQIEERVIAKFGKAKARQAVQLVSEWADLLQAEIAKSTN
ncbi:MarR family winged helix-turn-helix transcriptional regulator [Lactobacillus sp.]|uniref:MarR family winged helix-turn-helix transcriptional regulator n=1 Tax=Lactobacillus sp. TaxID=1591 RepID=UPI003EF3AE41